MHIFTEGFQSRISEDINADLIRLVGIDEIKRAVFSIHPSKAPGEDGLTAIFFQQYCEIIVPDFINHTIISLIPKVKQVQYMRDLRLIGLCNVFYKIIAKVITNRLQIHMNSIISPEQNVFLKDQLISDNILINHGVLHSLNLRKNWKNFRMAVKLDVSKPYECILKIIVFNFRNNGLH